MIKKTLTILIMCLLIPLIALAATEDFTTYTEVDLGGDYTITAPKIDISSIQYKLASYVYFDKGVDYFNSDFEHDFEVYVDSTTDDGYRTGCWAVANDLGGYDNLWYVGAKSFLWAMMGREGSQTIIKLDESDSGTTYEDYWLGGSTNTLYYLTVKRDEAVGTYGTIYVYIYSDSSRTTLVDTLSIALHTSKKDYRYIYGTQGTGYGTSVNTITGYVQNLDLSPGAGGAKIIKNEDIILFE